MNSMFMDLQGIFFGSGNPGNISPPDALPKLGKYSPHSVETGKKDYYGEESVVTRNRNVDLDNLWAVTEAGARMAALQKAVHHLETDPEVRKASLSPEALIALTEMVADVQTVKEQFIYDPTHSNNNLYPPGDKKKYSLFGVHMVVRVRLNTGQLPVALRKGIKNRRLREDIQGSHERVRDFLKRFRVVPSPMATSPVQLHAEGIKQEKFNLLKKLSDDTWAPIRLSERLEKIKIAKYTLTGENNKGTGQLRNLESKDEEALFILGLFDQALEGYNFLIKSNPGMVSLWLSRSRVLTAMERHDEALKNMEWAIGILNQSIEKTGKGGIPYLLYADLALAARKAGKEEKAVKAYSHALGHDPEHPGWLTERGLAYWELGKKENSCKDWRAACNLMRDRGRACQKENQLCR